MDPTMETIRVFAPLVDVPEFESFDRRLVHAIADVDGPSFFAVESVERSDQWVVFTWYCVALPLVRGHERAVCRFLSERLVESWQTTRS